MNTAQTLTLPTDQEIRGMSTESRQLWQNKNLSMIFSQAS